MSVSSRKLALMTTDGILKGKETPGAFQSSASLSPSIATDSTYLVQPVIKTCLLTKIKVLC